MPPTQTITQQDLNTQIQEVIALKLSWEQLTPKQKALFNNSEEFFNSLVSDFETGSTVNAALLEDLVSQMNEDLDLKDSLSNYSQDQQDLIEKLVKIRIEQIRLEQRRKNKQALKQIKPEIDKLNPKADPRQEIIKVAKQVVGSSNKAAVEKFIGICLTSDLDLSNPQDLELAKTIALGKNQLYEKISQAIQPATDQDYVQAIQGSDPTKTIDPQTNVVINLNKLPLPAQVKPLPIVKATPLSSDLCDTLSTEIKKLKVIADNPKAQKISHGLITQVTDQQLDQLTHAINQTDPTILQIPTQKGQQAAAIIKQNPTSSVLSPQVIKLYSQGLTYQQWAKIYQKAQIPPRQAYELHQQLKSLDNSQLGKEISEPLTKSARRFQTFTNKVSSKLPQKIGKPFNKIFHPVQSIKSWFGKQIGKRLGVKIYKAFAKKVTNKTARLVAKTLLREGIKAGAKTLIKLGLKAGLTATGIGAIVVAGLEIGSFILKKIIGGIQNIAQSIWGEKIKTRDLLALPALAVAGIGSVFAALGTATVAAAGSAGATVAISAIAGVFIYITAFTVAPLISTIAQLESEPFYNYSFTGTPSSPSVPTGPIPPGCPSGWPTSGYIIQGAKAPSSHYSVEAVDFDVGMGTPIVSTHAGKAIAGYNTVYGNYVDVFGICQGITFVTRYGHMPYIPFQGERIVAAGEQIGVVNNTGASGGDHLHYEIRGGVLGDINQFLPIPVPRGCVGFNQCGSITVP